MAPLVLVIDDDIDVLDILSIALELDGFRVAAAEDAAKAMECVEAERPDLVLLDVHLPGRDGPWLAEEWRRRGYNFSIITMTSDPEPEIWAQVMGAIGWIAKPFAVPALLQRIEIYAAAA